MTYWVFRGGSWLNRWQGARVALYGRAPDFRRGSDLGFRVARSPTQRMGR